MSGPGGGGGGGGGGPSSPVECLRLIFRTTLNSPNPTTVPKLKVNDELAVEVQGERGPVVVKTEAGEIAGSITGSQLVDLIKCIADGYDYVATVRQIEKARVEVEIRPVPQ